MSQNSDERLGRLGYVLSLLTVAGVLSIVCMAVLTMVSIFVSQENMDDGVAGVIVWLVVNIPFLVYAIKVSTLRLHDLNKSGWYAVFLFLPFANFVLIIMTLLMPGVRGQNRYGMPSDRKLFGWFIVRSAQ